MTLVVGVPQRPGWLLQPPVDFLVKNQQPLPPSLDLVSVPRCSALCFSSWTRIPEFVVAAAGENDTEMFAQRVNSGIISSFSCQATDFSMLFTRERKGQPHYLRLKTREAFENSLKFLLIFWK